FEKYIHNYQDVVIMIDIPYEERQYKREKRKAVIELATTLNIEVLN
ncbi:ArpU family phage packaging/lysis transcriptional regulator, partial [Listeria monocytogenes]